MPMPMPCTVPLNFDAAAVHIRGQLDRLTDAQIRQLCFFVVASTHTLAATMVINGAPGAICWPTCAAFGYHAVNQREHAARRLLLMYALRNAALAASMAGWLWGCTGDLRGRGFALLGRGFVGGLRLNQGIARLIVFLFAHRARADQFSAAIDRILCGLYRAACLA